MESAPASPPAPLVSSGPIMASETLLTSSEVAELLRVHPKHVYRLLKKGLPARRVGSEWRFDRGEVLAWSGGGERAARLGAQQDEAPRLPEPAVPSVVAANGDVAVMILLQLLAARGPPLVGFAQADKARAFELLAQGSVLAAGAHAGGFPTHVGTERAARVHLVRREIGLVSRPRSGGRVLQLRDLARLKLASRPTSAGVRIHLDTALREEGLDPEKIHRDASLLASHLDVVLAVASGRADVGLASRAWGERAGLAFRLLAIEDYGLIVKASSLGDPRIVRICETAQGKAYRAEVGAVPGYDAEGAGDIRYDA